MKSSFAAPITALVIIVLLYMMSRVPQLPKSEAQQIAKRFSFERIDLPDVGSLSGTEPKSIRSIHPDLQHFSAWISFVGAAVSLGDLDGDGRSNDMLFVDSRYDEILVCPVPGTGERYAPFLLSASKLPFDGESTAPMGTLLGDFNEDGRTDILAYFWGRSPIVFSQVENQEPSLAAFQESELVSPRQLWHTSCATQADLDGDGHFDLIVGNYNPDDAETLNPKASGNEAMMASWARATNGGKSRMFLWSNGDGEARFTEAENAMSADVACGWTFAVGATDMDNDFLPEVYLVHDFGADCFLHNRSKPGELKFALMQGKRSWTTSRSKVIGLDTFHGMGIDIADLNGDLKLDMMISNICSEFGFQESNLVFIHSGQDAGMSHGTAPFDEKSEGMGLSRGGWAWETRFGDFDNDGTLEVMQATGFTKGTINRWPELHELLLSNEELAQYPILYPFLGGDAEVAGHERNPFFVQHDGRYYDIAPQLALSEPENPMLSRGIATADVDGDGRLDFAVANNWEDSYFFQNTSDSAGGFLGLHLRLPLDVSASSPDGLVIQAGHPDRSVPSLPAIGATAIVQLSDDSRPAMIGYVDGGTGHSGHRAPELHFGLGEVDKEARISATIAWRDRNGTVQKSELSDLAPGWHTVMLYSDNANE